MRRRLAVVLSLAAWPLAAQAPHRAIVLSIDSFNEQRVRSTIGADALPALGALFDGGACADRARPMFPSVTAASHAAIWTGTWGNRSGIAGNRVQLLPAAEHTVMESQDGFGVRALSAEPLWIAAARQGVDVVGHHVTQAPFAPGFPLAGDSAALRRARADSALARTNAFVVNGYNRHVAPARVITERQAAPHAPGAWRGLERLPATAPAPREVAWALPTGDSLFALVTGDGRYDRLLVAATRDLAAAVEVRAAEARPATPAEPLASRFAEPLVVTLRDRPARVFVRLRLFALDDDASHFVLFQPLLDAVEGNRAEVAQAYDDALRGWYGNAPTQLYERGEFGPRRFEGGDGTAEARFIEGAELVARSFTDGAAWAWRTRHPTLLLTYLPLGDDIDHAQWGDAAPGAPVAPARAANAQALRRAVWALVDRHVAALQQLVRDTPGAALFVTGDHGMRATGRVFRPNVVLARAGLVAFDSAGSLELARTRAISPNGYWISINRAARKQGAVAPADEATVLDTAERALRDARDEQGRPVVLRTWRAAEHDTLGMGGPAGGDLYYEVAEGTRWSAELRGAVVSMDAFRSGNHGFPSTAPDMATVFCAWGAPFAPHRVGDVRIIDMAPTVSAWLGLAPPADATGIARLDALSRR